MKEVHRRAREVWYEHDGVFFRVPGYCFLMEDEIRKKIENPQLPSYCSRTFEDMSVEPLIVFRVSDYKLGAQNMSLYEYLVLVKGMEDVNPVLKSVCMQTDYDPLVFAVESYDEESEVCYEGVPIQKRIDEIEKAVGMYAKELMTLSGKDGYSIDWYL